MTYFRIMLALFMLLAFLAGVLIPGWGGLGFLIPISIIAVAEVPGHEEWK